MWSVQLSLSVSRDSTGADPGIVRRVSNSDDFADSIRRLASDQAKRVEANDRAQEAAAEQRKSFMLRFYEKVRKEIEPVFEEAARALKEGWKVGVSIRRSDDEDRITLVISDRQHQYELLFLADPLKLWVTVHRGDVVVRGDADSLSRWRAIREGQTPALESLSLQQIDRAEVERQVQSFLSDVLR